MKKRTFVKIFSKKGILTLISLFFISYTRFDHFPLMQACLGRNSCSVEISNLVFGGDPCRHVIKTLAVEAICTSSSNVGSAKF